MKELIVFAGEILFMAVVIGMYDKSEKFQQKIKSIGRLVSRKQAHHPFTKSPYQYQNRPFPYERNTMKKLTQYAQNSI